MLFAGGGQDPSHAWALCRELGIGTFVVTPTATGQSAYGAGTCELKRTISRPCYLRLTGEHEIIAGDLDDLAADLAMMTGNGDLKQTVAIRYRGQAHHLDVPVVDGLTSPEALEKTLRGFE